MGPVVVLLLLFKTFTNISIIEVLVAGKEARYLERECMKGSNPEESFIREVSTYV